MKNIESMKDYCESRNDRYIIALSPDEFYYIKSALTEYTVYLRDEIDTFEWLDTPDEHRRLETIERLSDELHNLPF